MGHRSNEFPNRHTINIVEPVDEARDPFEGADGTGEEDLGEYAVEEFAEGDSREFVNCIVEWVLPTPKQEEKT